MQKQQEKQNLKSETHWFLSQSLDWAIACVFPPSNPHFLKTTMMIMLIIHTAQVGPCYNSMLTVLAKERREKKQKTPEEEQNMSVIKDHRCTSITCEKNESRTCCTCLHTAWPQNWKETKLFKASTEKSEQALKERGCTEKQKTTTLSNANTCNIGQRMHASLILCLKTYSCYLTLH